MSIRRWVSMRDQKWMRTRTVVILKSRHKRGWPFWKVCSGFLQSLAGAPSRTCIICIRLFRKLRIRDLGRKCLTDGLQPVFTGETTHLQPEPSKVEDEEYAIRAQIRPSLERRFGEMCHAPLNQIKRSKMRLTDFKVLTFDCYETLIDWRHGS